MLCKLRMLMLLLIYYLYMLPLHAVAMSPPSESPESTKVTQLMKVLVACYDYKANPNAPGGFSELSIKKGLLNTLLSLLIACTYFANLKIFGLAFTNLSSFFQELCYRSCVYVHMHDLACTNFSDYANRH